MIELSKLQNETGATRQLDERGHTISVHALKDLDRLQAPRAAVESNFEYLTAAAEKNAKRNRDYVRRLEIGRHNVQMHHDNASEFDYT